MRGVRRGGTGVEGGEAGGFFEEGKGAKRRKGGVEDVVDEGMGGFGGE